MATGVLILGILAFVLFLVLLVSVPAGKSDLRVYLAEPVHDLMPQNVFHGVEGWSVLNGVLRIRLGDRRSYTFAPGEWMAVAETKAAD
jgi:hypothetical protein